MSSIITPEELKQELDQMADGFCQENHVGKITETASYKEFMSEKEKCGGTWKSSGPGASLAR